MENNSHGTSDAFMEVVVKKMELHDEKISEFEERLTSTFHNDNQMQQLLKSIEELKKAVNPGQSLNKLPEFSTRLDLAINLLRLPMKSKVYHHHHIPKLIWLTIRMFLILSLACSGWYVTGQKLKDYIANDTKYRQLKLDTANVRLQKDLNMVDSFYQVTPDLRTIVIKLEEINRKNLEMLKKLNGWKMNQLN